MPCRKYKCRPCREGRKNAEAIEKSKKRKNKLIDAYEKYMDTGKENWEKFGKKDPYYWVTTDSEFRDVNLTRNVMNKFFKNGKSYINNIFKIIKKHLDPDFSPERVLDFGCGVGRIAIPLAMQCKNVLGVDVAESMIKEAEKNKKKFGVNNLKLSADTDSLIAGNELFDFIHSIYVFQHIRPEKGLQIFINLVDKLKENGTGMFHFITVQSRKPVKQRIIYWLSIHFPLFNAINNIRIGKPFSHPIYEMNNYSLNTLFEILRKKECRHIYVRHTKEGHYRGVMLFFQKKHKENNDFISLGEIP